MRKTPPFRARSPVAYAVELIHPFTDGNGRVGRALMNFVLERSGYPTMYLGLPERKAYLNAIRPADDRDFGSIAAMLITTCLHQHRDVSDTVNAGMEETRVTPATDT
ncbi:MAG: Fic family protein [Methanoregula sp.]|nr:Fic family protein [Methanoregula sp.]